MPQPNKFGWNEALSTGNELIDGQHKELIARIFKIMENIDKWNKEQFNETLNFLQEYVIDHFGAEEKIMLNHSYPEFPDHRDEHSYYVKSIFDLKQRAEEKGVTTELIYDVEEKLADWLLDHILSTDIKMAHFIKSCPNASYSAQREPL